MDKRTYRYSNEEPLYPFGFGLSYTRFVYSDLKLERTELTAGQAMKLSFTVNNAGELESGEVTQIYLTDVQASSRVPLQKLVGFQRVQLKPGETCTVNFTITAEMMMFVDDDGESKLEPGSFQVQVGGCLPGSRGQQLGAPSGLAAGFAIK